jgi:hypothetical protein
MDPEQRRRLHQALLAAFDQDGLERMVRYRLNERLGGVVPPGPLQAVVFRLIEWAEQHGRVEELVRAARDERPGNREVQAAAEELLGPDPQRPHVSPAVGDEQRGRRDLSVTTPPGRPVEGTRPMDRRALVSTLSRLAPPDLALLVTALGAAAYVSGAATVPEQAAQLIRWAESPTGPGLEELRATAAAVLPTFR